MLKTLIPEGTPVRDTLLGTVDGENSSPGRNKSFDIFREPCCVSYLPSRCSIDIKYQDSPLRCVGCLCLFVL